MSSIHFELVSELSTACLFAALQRLISQKGCLSKIISDNDFNYKGAARHLKELAILCQEEKVQRFLLCEVHWVVPSFFHMILDFGGLWEAAVKTAKQLLMHWETIVNAALLSFEEVNTLLLQVEGCLNSRLLIALLSEANDLNALTLVYFLVGGSIH